MWEFIPKLGPSQLRNAVYNKIKFILGFFFLYQNKASIWLTIFLKKYFQSPLPLAVTGSVRYGCGETLTTVDQLSINGWFFNLQVNFF